MYFIIWQRLAVEATLDIILFPVWWYSRGTARAFLRAVEIFKNGNARLAPGLWLKNIFVPMFGQYDWQGRVISFFMRFFQVLARSLALLVWLLFCFVIFLVWLVFPVVVIMGIFKSIVF